MTNRSLRYVIGISTALLTTTAFSLPPVVPGPYFALAVTGSYPMTSTSITTSARPSSPSVPATPSEFNNVGTLKQNGGGGGLLELGYRFPCFRVEGEFLYNYNQNSSLTFPDTQFTSSAYNNVYYLAGATQEYIGLLNFYYDFRPTAASGSNVFPYAGVGIGYSKFTTIVNFSVPQVQGGPVINRPDYLSGVKTSLYSTAPVVQGILGLNLAMDSYMDFFLDLRYLAAASNKTYHTSYQVATVNLGVSFLLTKGLS